MAKTKIIQESEIMQEYSHEKLEWIMLKNPNLIEDENGSKRDYGPYNGWQTWSGDLMKDDEGNYTMVWIPYWGDRDEVGLAHDLFEKFYSAKLKDGTTASYGGYITNLEFADLYGDRISIVEKTVHNEETDEDEVIYEEVTENVKVGEVLVGFDFDEVTYNKYVDSLPSRVPDVVATLCANSDSNAENLTNQGTVANSVQATFLAIDGSEVKETPAFAYNAKNRQALESAVLRVTNGAKSTSVTFNDEVLPVRMSREEVLRLYLEMETYLLQVESKNTAFKAMVNAHKNDAKDQAGILEIKYADPNMELEPKYQDMFNSLMETGYQDLQDMAEQWGINE